MEINYLEGIQKNIDFLEFQKSNAENYENEKDMIKAFKGIICTGKTREQLDVPIKEKVGFYYTGKYTEDKHLTVIDFDKDNEEKENLFDLEKIPYVLDTLSVKTMNGGIHLYFWTTFPVRNKQFPKNQMILPGLKGIDFRGTHGKIIAPGTTVGNKKYEIYNNGEIKFLTQRRWKQFLKAIIKPSKNKKKRTPKKRNMEEKENEVRKAFQDILSGKLDIRKASTTSGIPIFQYWGSLFKEIINCSMDLEESYGLLEENQTEFKKPLAISQIQSMGDKINGTISTHYYNQLFRDSGYEISLTSNVEEEIYNYLIDIEQKWLYLNEKNGIFMRWNNQKKYWESTNRTLIIRDMRAKVAGISPLISKTIMETVLEGLIIKNTLQKTYQEIYHGNWRKDHIIPTQRGFLNLNMIKTGNEVDYLIKYEDIPKNELEKMNFFNLYSYNFRFDNSAGAYRFCVILRDIAKNEPKILAILLHMFSYYLCLRNQMDTFFALLGQGGNGKGTLVNLLQSFFSNIITFNMNLQSRFDLANIGSVPLVTMSEAGEGKFNHVYQIYKITGGDAIKDEDKYRSAITIIKPMIKLIFQSNTFQEVPIGTEEAMRRRLIAIELTNSFRKVADENIKEDLMKEKAGIFNLVLKIRHLTKKFILLWKNLENSLEVAGKYRGTNEMDEFFHENVRLVEKIEHSPMVQKRIATNAVFQKYREFCEERKKKNLFQKKEFAKEFGKWIRKNFRSESVRKIRWRAKDKRFRGYSNLEFVLEDALDNDVENKGSLKDFEEMGNKQIKIDLKSTEQKEFEEIIKQTNQIFDDFEEWSAENDE